MMPNRCSQRGRAVWVRREPLGCPAAQLPRGWVVSHLERLDFMDESREILRATVLEVVDNQIRDGTPPATRQTFERLQNEGHPAAEAKRLIAGVVAAEVFSVFKSKQAFDEARFVQRLHQLPEMPWNDNENG